MPDDQNQPPADQTTPSETKTDEEPEEKPAEQPVVEEQPKPVESPKPEEPKTFKPKVNVEEEIKKQLDEKVSELLQKANEKRKQRREKNLNQVIELAGRKQINNQAVRDLLQVSQSTASNYLSKLVKSGRLKVERRAKATVYST